MNTLALHIIKTEEGYRQFPYRDTLGKLTVGYGLNLDDVGLSEDEAAYIATRRIVDLQRGLREAQPAVLARLSPVREAVLISMAYQMGLRGVLSFKRMWTAMAAGNWRKVYDEALDSAWARQTPKRAARHARQLLEDKL